METEKKTERYLIEYVTISKARKDLKYTPKVNLTEGLKKVFKQEKIFLNWP